MGVGGCTTSRPLYPRERPGTHCTGNWVGHRAGLDGCGKSCPPPGFRSPDLPAPSESLYRLSYPGSRYDEWGIINRKVQGRKRSWSNRDSPNVLESVEREQSLVDDHRSLLFSVMIAKHNFAPPGWHACSHVSLLGYFATSRHSFGLCAVMQKELRWNCYKNEHEGLVDYALCGLCSDNLLKQIGEATTGIRNEYVPDFIQLSICV